LDYGDIELESSFLVLGRDCGRTRRVLTLGFLITGGPYPVVVDTGYRSNQIMETLGMRGLQFHENMIENQLARHGVRMGDVRYVCHTHLHIDHAGKDDLFPMNTTVVLNRKELEYSVSGLMHPQYPAPDIKHLIDRLHTKSALRFLDLELTGPIELMPGVYCDAANAHTEGSMNIHVHTADGIATICGDVIYDFNDQIVTPFHEINDAEPRTTGNHGPKRGEGRDQEAPPARNSAAGARPAGEDPWPGDRRRMPSPPGGANLPRELGPDVRSEPAHAVERMESGPVDPSRRCARSVPVSSLRKGRSGIREKDSCSSPTCRAMFAAATIQPASAR
jgi:glyoxylase-like metal-dependent hydrolase (beta-lactamase superfamily II)